MTQKDALEILKSGANVFLTGEPGAGKSHTINMFNQWAAERGSYPAITASTGIAATHINGMTIHSWSGIGIKEEIGEYEMNKIMQRDYIVRRILDTRILIIDEVSMLNAQTIDNVDRVCREVKAIHNMAAHGLPFGGIQVIFVGDFFQLPPVNKSSKETKFAFESAAWLAAEPKICYLTEQHRQEDKAFLQILTALRAGTLSKSEIKTLKARSVPAPKNITRLFTHNADVDRVNSEELAKLRGEKIIYKMQSSGLDFLVDALKKNCLSPETLEIKIGAPVMFTRNEINKDGTRGEFVNGTLGTVISINSSGYPIIKTTDGRKISIGGRQVWSVEERGITKASIEQFPLRLAWAITVHKCQGMSLDAATMDLSEAFEYGQGYVALSRVRSLSGLYLEGINEQALEMHPTVIKKDGMFRKLGV